MSIFWEIKPTFNLSLKKNNSFKLESEIISINKNKSKHIVIDKKNKKYEFLKNEKHI